MELLWIVVFYVLVGVWRADAGCHGARGGAMDIVAHARPAQGGV